MIKVNKPRRFAKYYKIPADALKDEKFYKTVNDQNKKLRFLPKNVLKVKFLKTRVGLGEDDFVQNRKTVVNEFLIYTFKR